MHPLAPEAIALRGSIAAFSFTMSNFATCVHDLLLWALTHFDDLMHRLALALQKEIALWFVRIAL